MNPTESTLFHLYYCTLGPHFQGGNAKGRWQQCLDNNDWRERVAIILRGNYGSQAMFMYRKCRSARGPKKNQSQDHERIKNLPNVDGVLQNVLAFGAKVTTRFCTEVATVLCSACDTNPKIFTPPSKMENRDKPSQNIVCALRTPSQNRTCGFHLFRQFIHEFHQLWAMRPCIYHIFRHLTK